MICDHRLIVRLDIRTGDGYTGWFHFSFFKKPGPIAEASPCRAFPISETLSAHTASETSWMNLRDWLKACEKHEACTRKGLLTPPKRVTDGGDADEKVLLLNSSCYGLIIDLYSSNVRLLCDSDLEGGKYTPLSHCWGLKPTATTTTSYTLEQRKQCIKWSELSKTFQDAITITRALKVRYIWIDALCIIQDDKNDWESEAAKMSLVYQNSYLNIAGSHACDSSGGCFHPTPGVSENTLFEIPSSSGVFVRTLIRETHSDFGTNYITTTSSPPLHRRCWVLQGRLLSPRVIYYMATEFVWECNTQVDCQCGVICHIDLFKPTYSLSLKRQLGSRPLRNQWMRVLERFTAQNITYPVLLNKHKMPVLWLQDLGHPLCWAVDNKRAATRYQTCLGPTWSWVSILGKIGFANRMDFLKQNNVLVSIDDLSIITGTDPTGKVLATHLLISGWSINATLHVTITTSGIQDYTLKTDLGDLYDKFVADTPFDNLRHPWTKLRVKLVSLIVFRHYRPQTSSIVFMVIRPARDRIVPDESIDRKGAFERLGIIQANWDEVDLRDTEDFDSRSLRTSFKWYKQATRFEKLMLV